VPEDFMRAAPLLERPLAFGLKAFFGTLRPPDAVLSYSA
jgi:hypothetical protein